MAFRSITQSSADRDFTNTFTAEYDADQTDAVMITPTTGKRLKVTDVKISTEGATSAGQKVRVEFGTTGDTAFTFFPTTDPDSVDSGKILVRGAQNESLTITSNLGGGKNYFVAVNYSEE